MEQNKLKLKRIIADLDKISDPYDFSSDNWNNIVEATRLLDKVLNTMEI